MNVISNLIVSLEVSDKNHFISFSVLFRHAYISLNLISDNDKYNINGVSLVINLQYIFIER